MDGTLLGLIFLAILGAAIGLSNQATEKQQRESSNLYDLGFELMFLLLSARKGINTLFALAEQKKKENDYITEKINEVIDELFKGVSESYNKINPITTQQENLYKGLKELTEKIKNNQKIEDSDHSIQLLDDYLEKNITSSDFAKLYSTNIEKVRKRINQKIGENYKVETYSSNDSLFKITKL